MRHKTATILLAMVWAAGCAEVRYEAQPTERTPYDAEWNKVRRVLAQTAALRYSRKPEASLIWQLPEVTEREGQGDCTALATLLYQRMLREQIRDARIVFGNWEDAWHAWVEWRGYILDPVRSARPERSGMNEYRPVWGYDLAGKYRFVEKQTKG